MKSRDTYVKTPTILQMEASECGAASLAMILSYYGQDAPLEKLRIETDVTRDGCNAGNIIRAARDRGFECGGYRKSAESLLTIDPPCVVFWERNHFVVFEGTKGRNVYINDPAYGERKMEVEDFIRSYSGIALIFKPDKDKGQEPVRFLRSHENKETISWIKHVIKEEAGEFTVVVALSFLIAVSAAIGAFMMHKLVLLLVCAAVCFACFVVRNVMVTNIQRRYTAVGSSRFMEKLFALPVAFFEQRYPGDITDRVSGEERASQFVAGTSLLIISNGILAIIFLMGLFISDAKAGIIGLLCVVTGYGVAIWINRSVQLAHTRRQVYRNKLAGRLFAAVSNTETIKAAGSEERYGLEELESQRKIENADREIEYRQLGAKIAILSLELIALVLMLVIWNRSSVALFCFFAVSLNAMVAGINSHRTISMDLMRTADVRRYLPEETAEADEQKEEKEYEKLKGNIVLDNITFGYGTRGEPLISGFSRKIDSGKSVGVTGGTGSGKSTLLKLIAGLYEPDSGEIYFDQRKRSEIPKEVLNTSIAFAMQKPKLFPGTIRDNITMWNPSITEREIIRAAKDACIHDVIMGREGGYDGLVTENGTNFSGGQRQRIEIARALAIDPSILILDEVTSALDRETSEKIIRNINKRGCTCIIASYQESIIKGCDEIIAF